MDRVRQENGGAHKVCKVCGDIILTGYTGEGCIECLCRVCWQWWNEASLQAGGPTWGRDQIQGISILQIPDWRERALMVDWPEPQFFKCLRHVELDPDDPPKVFDWSPKIGSAMPDDTDD